MRSSLALLGLTSLFVLSSRSAASDWPQLLGPSRNGVSTDPVASSWPKEGPTTRWKMDVGRGFSGPAVRDGKLILFHRRGNKELVESFQADDGKPHWKYEYGTAYKDDFGFDPGPRAVPTITQDKVFTLGADGELHCLELETGKKLWNVRTREQFKAAKGFFGMACSPLVIAGKVLLNIGGENGAGIVAFDEATGALLWKSTDDEASYSSPVSATFGGKTCALFVTRGRLLALDPENGKPQFELPWRARSHASVNAATPLVIDDLIFISSSYEVGAGTFRVRDGTLEKLWASDEVLSNHYATSVHFNGNVYGFHGRQEYGPSLRCVALKTGEVRWSRENIGAGTVLLAADKMLVLLEDGQLLLLEASSDAYRELQRAQILPEGVRAYPALANGLLYARNKDKLVCVEVGRKQE